jgi:hypothetical protein
MLARILAAAGVLAWAAAEAKLPPPCRDGRFAIQLRGAPALLVLGGNRLAISGTCDAIGVRPRNTRKGTRLRARWPSCAGVSGKLRFRGTVVDGCTRLEGTFRSGRAKPVPVAAVLSRCGDGAIDPATGEECEGASGCTPGTVCDEACHCLPAGVTTTTTTSTPGSSQPTGTGPTATTTTQPPPFPGLPADIAGYAGWLKLNRDPIPPLPFGDPHEGTKDVFVNQAREVIAPGGTQVYPFPEGAIVVKIARRDGFIRLFAIMRKRAGSDPAHGDWEFVEYTRARPQGRFTEAARGEVCWSCHVSTLDRDWVFTPLD